MKHMKEKNLIKQAEQTGTSKGFRQRRGRKLMPVLLLLLLFTHQTWASGLCLCKPEGKAPHTGCHTTQSPDQPKAEAPLSGCHTAHLPGQITPGMPEAATPQSTHHCSEAESLVADAQPGKLAHSTMICCHLQPDTEAQAIPVTAQNQGLIVATLPFIYIGAQHNSAPLPDNFHHPHQKRPLYLSYSCLLI
jgi:hypothetical protein